MPHDPALTDLPMTTPLLSFCIPTHQRSRYLASLLESLLLQLDGFAYTYEIVIADNASTDDTGEVVRSYADRLPIRYLRHAANIGGYPNWQFVMSHGLGRYLVYLSDDDSILGPQLSSLIAKMEADPELAVVYAPWLLYDLVGQQPQGQFYSVPHDLRIERGQHATLLDHVLRHGIFPEIAVLRREVFQATMPRINAHAFLAFVHSTDYLRQGAVLIQKEPFYVAITHYFADEEREQLGTDEVEVAWDRYRGGLEYMLAACGNTLTAEERSGYHLRVQRLIADRIAVAIRVRHHKGRSAIDNYYLGMRLRGLGYEHLLPVPMHTLASQAMVEFMLQDPEIHRGMAQIICVGQTPPPQRDFFARSARVPVRFEADLDDCTGLTDALLFVRDDAPMARDIDSAQAAQHNVRVLHERHLAAKFGL
jgi:poly(ribitol-phosphate) beta-N-acetylglucosaminyltransferase